MKRLNNKVNEEKLYNEDNIELEVIIPGPDFVGPIYAKMRSSELKTIQ